MRQWTTRVSGGHLVLHAVVVLGVVLGLLGLGGPFPARAATIAVGCDVEALIAAITSAPDGAILALAADCPYTLTQPHADSDSGLPVIAKTLTIQGHGATIARDDADGTPEFRLFEVAATGTLHLEDLTLAHGRPPGAEPWGGAIYNGGTLTLSESTVRDNAAYRGGAIYNDGGDLTVTNSTLSGNTATVGVGDGGAIYNAGDVTVTRSTLLGNAAGDEGGAIYNAANGQLMVTASTLSGNTARFSGAIDNFGTATVTNSTLSSNTAARSGGVIFNNPSGELTVTNSTLSGNTASEDGDAIYNRDGDVTLTGSILAHAVGDTGALCVVVEGSMVDGGYNLATDASCALTAAGSENDVALDSLALGGLGDNGGPTETIALGPTSVAIDRIPADVCVDPEGEPLTTDQRGVARPQGAGCDVGAFEVVYQAALTLDPTAPVVVDRTTRRATLTLGSTVTVDQGDAQWALPVTYTLTPLGDGTLHTCSDEHGSGGDATTLHSVSSLPGIPAGRYTVTASVGSNYTSDPATATVVVVDPVAGFVTGGGMVQGGMLSFSASYYGTQLNGAISYQRTGSSRVILSTQRLTSFVRVGTTVYVEGEASLNGVSGYRVLLTAVDNPGLQRDQVQLQVWDRDGNLVESASFDRTPLLSGQVYLGPGL